METASLGIAVVGAGRIGAVHVRNVARKISGVRLIGVADVDRAAAQRLVDEVSAGRVDDVSALLDDPSVHGVIIATPTDTHAGLVAQAARAGKHILCEKPISLRLDATRSAIADAARARVLLQVGFQRRFDDEFSNARRLVESGKVGVVRFLRLVGRDHHMPSLAYLRTSGGQYRDQMVHEFDMARWLMAPREVVEVYATGSALIDTSIQEFHDVDTSLACLRFDDGALAVIDDSRETTYGYDVRGEIHGSKAMLLVGHKRFSNRGLVDAADSTPDVQSFIERFEQAYRDEVADFVSAVRDRRAPRVGGADALEALRIALAADRSRRELRPVRLSDVTDD